MTIFQNPEIEILMEQLITTEKIRDRLLQTEEGKKNIRAIENVIQKIKDKIDKEAGLK